MMIIFQVGLFMFAYVSLDNEAAIERADTQEKVNAITRSKL